MKKKSGFSPIGVLFVLTILIIIVAGALTAGRKSIVTETSPTPPLTQVPKPTQILLTPTQFSTPQVTEAEKQQRKTRDIILGPCHTPHQLDVATGLPFKPDAQEALLYFKTRKLKIIEPSNRDYSLRNVYFVVEIPSGTSGEYWIDKMSKDGFTNVTYHRIIGCDVAEP